MKILYILLLLSLSYSATLLVPDEYDSIQSAIDAASEGDSVLVSAGTYLENINFNGKNIALIGEDRETTIIDGNQNGSVVTFENGEDSTAVLNRFTIKNGSGQYDLGSTYGSGTLCGGGLAIVEASPTIKDLIIKDNMSDYGGGAFIEGSNTKIYNSNFIGNSSNGTGGAIENRGNEILLINCLISENSSGSEGIIQNYMGHVLILGCTISKNSTTYDGGAISISYSDDVSVINSVIHGNYTNAIFIYAGEDEPNQQLTVSYSDIEGGLDGIAYSDFAAINWLDGNIDSDPLFVDPENGDYTLQSISPCIDAGDPASELDPDGTRADMGAYYYYQEQGCAGPCGQELDACGSVINSCWPCCMLGMCGLATGQAECEEGFGSFYPDYLGDGFSCGGLEGEGTPNPPPMDECGVCGGDNSTCTGCTDSYAINYNPDATIDDGSCEYVYDTILSFGVLDLSSHTLEINLENTMPVSGFQFEVDLGESMSITEVSGGSTEEMGFMVDFSENNNVVLGFSIDGNEIDVGIETLANLTFSGYGQATVCLSNAIIISGFEDAEYFDVEYGYCITINYMKGDVNLDEALDILDLVMVMNIIFENIAPDENEIWAADYNSDGDINIMDIVQIVNCILSGCWEGEPLCDIDGNCYETIQIGEQVWMAENLKVTHYNDGSEIPTGLSSGTDGEWVNTTEGAYAVYVDDPSNADTYGNLYNWYTVDDDRGVCPDGWHVPSDAEYTILTTYLGGLSVAGGKMKSTGTIQDGDGLWNYYSDEITEEATNESGFTAFPAGYRNYNIGTYDSMGSYGSFWSSSESNSNYAWYRDLSYNYSSVYRTSYNKQNGFSVRCLGD